MFYKYVVFTEVLEEFMFFFVFVFFLGGGGGFTLFVRSDNHGDRGWNY